MELTPLGVVEGIDSEGALQIEVRAADGERWVVRRSVGDLVHLGRKLRHLVLNRCGNVTDLSPVAVADACADLESLGLEGCSRVSDVGALALARHEAIADAGRALLAATG